MVETLKNEFEFKAEMKQLLSIIVHSLYTHPEIFLRELVSNASDALNKLRFHRLTDENILNPELELKIDITLDKDNSVFTIEDSGVGMTFDDLIDNIGTIASSGTMEFLKQLSESQKSIDGQLIGQFGVGFYSVYMVTDEVTIETTYHKPGSKTYRWKSDGGEKFTIEEIDSCQRGTKIFFKLKDERKEFCNDFTIKNILKKYSNFVDFPIYINNELVNSVTALWHRKKEDIKDEELEEFYQFITNDFQKPLGYLHLSIEGNINFKALVFIPETPPSVYFKELEKSLHLYSRKIFIQDDCPDILPDYLKFLKGIVDSEDMPLNVSREVTQFSPVMNKIKSVLTSKILNLLEDWAENDKEKYNTFFKNFGTYFKTGINSDYTNKQKIVELLRFETTKTEKAEYTSLKEYKMRMKTDQDDIYFVMADHRDSALRNPNIEYFKKNDLEVLLLTDPVDIFTIPYLFDYEGKKLVSIEKAEIDIKKTKDSVDEPSESIDAISLIETIKGILGDRVENVAVSARLVDSPITIVSGKQGLDSQVEKMMKIIDKNFSESKKILEINPSHKLIKNLSVLNSSDRKNPVLRDTVLQLFDGALLLEGNIKSPSEFITRMNELLFEATQKQIKN